MLDVECGLHGVCTSAKVLIKCFGIRLISYLQGMRIVHFLIFDNIIVVNIISNIKINRCH